jgi:hypothetical protein
VFLARRKTIRTKNTVIDKSNHSAGILYQIADCARMVFIRAQSTIRADAFTSAQLRNPATVEGAISAAMHSSPGAVLR